jgi:hypothetical protein
MLYIRAVWVPFRRLVTVLLQKLSCCCVGDTVHSEPWPLPRLLSIGLNPVFRLQFLSPIIFRSSSTEGCHIIAGLPTRRIPSGLWRIIFLQGFCSCVLKRCPSHLNLPDLITFIISVSLYNWYNSWSYFDPHIQSDPKVTQPMGSLRRCVALVALWGRGGIAPTHSWPRH